MIRTLTIITFLYFATIILLALQPSGASSGNYLENLVVHFLFLGCLISSSLFYFLFLPTLATIKQPIKTHAQPQLYYIVSIIISIIGLGLIAYDRIFIRGVDYTIGVRAARYQWLASEGGNLQGIVGNLIISFSYYTVAFLIFYKDRIPRNYKYVGVISSMLCFIGISFLNGGRSNLLVLVFYVLAINLLRRNKLQLKKVFNLTNFTIALLLYFVASYVTSSSADLGFYTPMEHYIDDVSALYGKAESDMPDYGPFNDIFYRINYFIVYILHGFWTAQIATGLINVEPFYILYPIQTIVSTVFGLTVPNVYGYFSDTGAFISLPGAFYYDYSIIGVIIGGMIIGLSIGCVFSRLRSGYVSSSALAISSLILLIALMSPFMIGYGFSTFFFIPIAFVFFDVLSIFKRRYYWGTL